MSDIPINPVTRRVQFTGNTGTGPFAFTFNIYAASDIAVYKNSTLLTLTTHYTVSIASNGTGSISLTGSGSGSALISSDVLTIVGARALSRTTDFVTAGDLRAVSLNEELDSSVIMSQQLDEKSDRALKFDQFDVYGSATLPVKAARLGTVLGFNATTGNPEAGPTIADVSALSAITADIATLADIQDGTVATSAITNVNTVRANVTTVAGISGNVTTVAGISANINTVVTNITDIQNAEENAAAAIVAKDAAVVAQGAAETAQTAAEAALDSFTDTYLGAFSSDPSADNDGNALTAGDLYFNTTSNIMKVYSGSVWQAVALSAADFLTTANNLSDLANAGTARSNLGLGTAATTAATAYVAKTSATGSGGLPAGTTAQRDGSPAAGYMRYNSTTSSFEGYSGSAWGAIPTDTTGGLAYLGATVGTSSQVLTSDGSGAPTWEDVAGGGTWTALQTVSVGTLAAGVYSSNVGFTSNKNTKQLTMKLNFTCDGWSQYTGNSLEFYLGPVNGTNPWVVNFALQPGYAPSGTYVFEVWMPIAIAASELYIANTGTNNYMLGSETSNISGTEASLGLNLNGGFNTTTTDATDPPDFAGVYYVDRFTAQLSCSAVIKKAGVPHHGSTLYSRFRSVAADTNINVTSLSYVLYGLV